MQDRILEFAEKADKLEKWVRELVSAGNEVMHALESCSIDPQEPEGSKTLQFHEIAPHLTQEIRDQIQAQYSNFMFTLLVVSRDAMDIDKMIKELKQIRVDLLKHKFKSMDLMPMRRKFTEYAKKVNLFEELMIELISRYETLVDFREMHLPSVLPSLSTHFRKKIKVS